MKNRFRGLSESRKLEMLQMSVEEIYNAGYEAGSKIVVGVDFGSGKDFTPVVKSTNQRRAELIQRAREFVEGRFKVYNNGVGEVVPRKGAGHCKVDFVVNQGKKTVVALLSLAYSGDKNVFKGISKCHPDEVFNADIGKAIALARALEIEIPQEFMDAVQPDVVVDGMNIKTLKSWPKAAVGPIEEGRIFKVVNAIENFSYECHAKSAIVDSCQITDDTNAQYEVPSC